MLPIAPLAEQAVLITGAARGLGRAIALHLAARGARIGIVDVDATLAGEVAAAIQAQGGTARPFAVDVADRAAMLHAGAQFAHEHGGLDALINNAMLLRYEPVEAISEAVADRMLGIGIKGALWGAQALLAHRRRDRKVCLLNMTSPVAERGYPNTALYSAVKGALVTLTRTLASELGPEGVRVNAISPGSVPTPGARGLNTEAEYERRARSIPLRRIGREDDVAAAAEYLLSPAADFVHGSILHVDGGIAAAG